jgi:hypothetical protein
MQVGQPTLTEVGAQIDAILLSLQVIERIGYHIPDWSVLKIQTLQQRSLDVPRVSESVNTGPTGFRSDETTSCGSWPGLLAEVRRGSASATPTLSRIGHTS